jgi:hypothetical protein
VRASQRLGNGKPSRWCPDLTTIRFTGGTARSNPPGQLVRLHKKLRVMLAIAVNETDRVCSLKELVGRTSIKGTMRSTIWLGILIGSTLGGLIPWLWGDGIFTYSSVLLSGVGAFVGLWVGFKISV